MAVPASTSSLVMDVSPNCDCHGENDVPIVPNVGMFASFDPVALDQACIDAVLAQPKMPNSVIGSGEACQCEDYFKAAPPGHRLGSRSDPQREDRPGQPGIRAGEDLISPTARRDLTPAKMPAILIEVKIAC